MFLKVEANEKMSHEAACLKYGGVLSAYQMCVSVSSNVSDCSSGFAATGVPRCGYFCVVLMGELLVKEMFYCAASFALHMTSLDLKA